jgi:glycosyltransferase involved in cell wall biosynthesis
MNSLTVVIPTFNRKALLQTVVEAYFNQTETAAIHELIIIDDGSTDGTNESILELAKRSPFPIRYLRQHNQGPAVARNLGIRETKTKVILFTDSDVVPEHDLVARHLEWHDKWPQDHMGMLGYVTWLSQPAPSPFMRWYGERQLFCYRRLRHGREADFSYFYTCNISLKTQFLKDHGQFDEDFKSAAYEDTELGYRLANAGLKLLFNRNAVAYHSQSFTFKDACEKARANDTATRTFYRKEAGQHFLKVQNKRSSQLLYRIAKQTARALVPICRPVKPLLDSPVPLPSLCYHLFFWYYSRIDMLEPAVRRDIR